MADINFIYLIQAVLGLLVTGDTSYSITERTEDGGRSFYDVSVSDSRSTIRRVIDPSRLEVAENPGMAVTVEVVMMLEELRKQ